MGQIVGTITRVRELPPKEDGEDQEPLVSVDVEGVNFLYRPNGADSPKQGNMIRGDFQVHWRKKQRPLHWLTDWSRLGF